MRIIAALLLAALCGLAQADVLQPSQYAAVKAYINSVPALASQPNTPDGNFEVARQLNLQAVPSFTVWQSQLTPDLMRAAIVQGAIQLDGLSQGKRDTLIYLAQGTLDARIAGVRQALDDETGSQGVLKAAVVAAEKRFATVIEKILATGIGSDASPATTTFEGAIGYQDVQAARSS